MLRTTANNTDIGQGSEPFSDTFVTVNAETSQMKGEPAVHNVYTFRFTIHSFLIPLVTNHDCSSPRHTKQTRSTILGKRRYQDSSSVSPANSFCEQVQTLENNSNSKRARTATVVVDCESGKENIPPFNITSLVHTDISPRAVTSSLEHATPTSNLTELSLLTPPPTPPASLLIHARVRALLRCTCNSTSSSIAGCDAERTSLLESKTNPPFCYQLLQVFRVRLRNVHVKSF